MSGHMSGFTYILMIYVSWVENVHIGFLGVKVEIVECDVRCPIPIYKGIHTVQKNKILGYK